MSRARATHASPATPATRGPSAASAYARLCRLCDALPATVCLEQRAHAQFRVRDRVYAYFLDDHHGDGIVSVCVKGEAAKHVDRVRRDPDRYYLPAYLGARGWFGLRLDRPRIDWREVAGIVEASYRRVAPRSLVRQLDGTS